MEEKYYLIFGANESNKGAQAMLYITATQIWKRDSSAQIIVLEGNNDFSELNIRTFYGWSSAGLSIVSKSILGRIACIAKGIRYDLHSREAETLDTILKNTKMSFDISGYALGSSWSFGGNIYYLLRCQVMQQYNIPMYIMPQSFGPFIFKSKIKQRIVDYCIKHYLGKVDHIFARENEGYQYLVERYHLTNVSRSDDLVFQHSAIDTKRLFRLDTKVNGYELKKNSVAIIPNTKTIKFGNEKDIMTAYERIIGHLLKLGKTVYIISHCTQDYAMCEMLKNMYMDEQRVIKFKYTPNCIEFEDIIKQVNYCIASRFHSIVHSFKEDIPCIAVGWSYKYKELLQRVSQEKYYMDVSKYFDVEKLIAMIDAMEEKYLDESRVINEMRVDIQSKSCFSFLDDVSR